jgi:8-oxo-dGTP pyrophosphatase MutT (NUDIX family)
MISKLNYRPAVFLVVYKKEKKDKEENKVKTNNKTKYLILKRKLHWRGYEFPKGGIEKGESIISAVKRECKEETGLKPIKIIKFNIKGKYKYNKILKDRPGYIGQAYNLFAAQVKETKNKKVKLDKKEHSGYAWLNFSQAIKKLTWKNQKKCLGVVDGRLEKY